MSAGLVLFRNGSRPETVADRFSLDLPSDLWGALDPDPVDGPDLRNAAFELELIWPPTQPPAPELFPYDLSPRRWRELSTWEQIGVVVQTASAVAGLVYLVYRLF